MTETPERRSTEESGPQAPDQQAGAAGKQTNPAVGKPRPSTPRPARRPRPSPLAVITAALGLFLIVLTLLAIQVRKGRDPALGSGPVTPVLAKPGAKATQSKAAQSQATKIVSRTSPAPAP
jgi:hypothetical protein